MNRFINYGTSVRINFVRMRPPCTVFLTAGERNERVSLHEKNKATDATPFLSNFWFLFFSKYFSVSRHRRQSIMIESDRRLNSSILGLTPRRRVGASGFLLESYFHLSCYRVSSETGIIYTELRYFFFFWKIVQRTIGNERSPRVACNARVLYKKKTCDLNCSNTNIYYLTYCRKKAVSIVVRGR